MMVKIGTPENLAQLKAGLTIRVHQKIKEGNKERIQIFEGLVIKINSGQNMDKTFTVRKIVEGVGVEKVFPFFSPHIAKIDIVKEANIRRAKLYYMRKRSGKTARLKERHLSTKDLAQMSRTHDEDKPEIAAQIQEKPQSELPASNIKEGIHPESGVSASLEEKEQSTV